jgi:hypothetical protein
MSHQPFETWLLSEEPLETDQAAALQAHLEICESCRSLSVGWAEVRNLFVHSTQVGPALGFTARWQSRLSAQQSSNRYTIDQEQSILFIGITAGIALMLLAAILAAGISVFNSPTQLLITGLYSLGNLINSLNAVENTLVVMTRILPKIVPISGWIILFALVGMLILAWTFVIQKILVPRRVIL